MAVGLPCNASAPNLTSEISDKYVICEFELSTHGLYYPAYLGIGVSGFTSPLQGKYIKRLRMAYEYVGNYHSSLTSVNLVEYRKNLNGSTTFAIKYPSNNRSGTIDKTFSSGQYAMGSGDGGFKVGCYSTDPEVDEIINYMIIHYFIVEFY